jgi:hypothetical protein
VKRNSPLKSLPLAVRALSLSSSGPASVSPHPLARCCVCGAGEQRGTRLYRCRILYTTVFCSEICAGSDQGRRRHVDELSFRFLLAMPAPLPHAEEGGAETSGGKRESYGYGNVSNKEDGGGAVVARDHVVAAEGAVSRSGSDGGGGSVIKNKKKKKKRKKLRAYLNDDDTPTVTISATSAGAAEEEEEDEEGLRRSKRSRIDDGAKTGEQEVEFKAQAPLVPLSSQWFVSFVSN